MQTKKKMRSNKSKKTTGPLKKVANIYTCPAEGCRVTLTLMKDVRRHYNSTHAKISFVCNICKRDFNRRDNLARHFKLVHKKNNDQALKKAHEVKIPIKFQTLSKVLLKKVQKKSKDDVIAAQVEQRSVHKKKKRLKMAARMKTTELEANMKTLKELVDKRNFFLQYMSAPLPPSSNSIPQPSQSKEALPEGVVIIDEIFD